LHRHDLPPFSNMFDQMMGFSAFRFLLYSNPIILED